jgi:hypothetical protein
MREPVIPRKNASGFDSGGVSAAIATSGVTVSSRFRNTLISSPGSPSIGAQYLASDTRQQGRTPGRHAANFRPRQSNLQLPAVQA